jgi:predicted polyphosphate/ATP-dependent NAD kinase
MEQVGIIANPASGKDIRRLVAYGTVFDNQEKVNIVRRLILSLAAAGIDRIVYMPEYHGIVTRAVNSIGLRHRPQLEIVPANICLTGTQTDSLQAAAAMAADGVNAIITMGGDGTNRLVAQGCRDVPILPISTGTNNVFPTMVEGTIAGLAAGAVAKGLVSGPPAINPSKQILVYKNGRMVDSALIDAVVLTDTFIGSRAVWDVARIRQIVVTRGQAHNIGISAIAGHLAPVTAEEERGVAITPGGGKTHVLAPIAPGLLETVAVQSYEYIAIGQRIAVATTPCVIALDGEREVEVGAGETAELQLTFDGPKVIQVAETLYQAVAQGFSRRICD